MENCAIVEKLLIVGSGGHARVVIDALELGKKFEIVGLVDDYRAPGDQTMGYTVVGRIPDVARLAATHAPLGVVIAVGDNASRQKIYDAIRGVVDVYFPVVVHPRASVARSAQVGEGSVLLAGATVGPQCDVGAFAIVNTNASLDHDSVVGRFGSLAPGVITGGGCRFGEFSATGIGAVVRHGITVGAGSVVGAGSTVLRDIPDMVVAYGTPAVVIRKRQLADSYL